VRWLLLGPSVVAALAVLVGPSPGRGSRVLASLRPRVGVLRQAHRTFATALPRLIAVWA
jgi:hypothetical protein